MPRGNQNWKNINDFDKWVKYQFNCDCKDWESNLVRIIDWNCLQKRKKSTRTNDQLRINSKKVWILNQILQIKGTLAKISNEKILAQNLRVVRLSTFKQSLNQKQKKITSSQPLSFVINCEGYRGFIRETMRLVFKIESHLNIKISLNWGIVSIVKQRREKMGK